MTRYNFFNSMYPEEAKKISRGYQELASHFFHLFDSTPDEVTDNPDKDNENGTDPEQPWYSDQISIQ